MAKKRSHPTHPTKPRPAAYTLPAMSDAELFRPQPETTPLPSVLATVFSLSLHGLLWAAPPILSMSREKPDLQRTVELVQLTPAEISRLSEFSAPAISMPPLPPSLPSTDVLPPPSPPQPPSTQTLERQEELVRQQIVQRQQELLQRQLQKQEELLNQQIRRNEELLQKQKLQQQQQLQRQLEQERQRQAQKLQVELEQEKQRQAQLRQQQEKQRQTELQWLQEQEKQRQEILKRQIEQEKQRQEILRRQQELEVLDQWQEQEKLLGQLQKQFQRQQKIEALKRIYSYDSSGTTEKEGTAKLTNWWQEKITQFPGIKLRPPEENTRVVKSTAKVQLPNVTPASIALLVNPEGKLEGEPLLMIGTSYPLLNQAIIEDAKKRSFEATGKYEIYTYRVEIDQSDLPPP